MISLSQSQWVSKTQSDLVNSRGHCVYLLGRNDSWKQEFKHPTRLRRRSVRMVRTTNVEPYLTDFRFFTCAPVYVHAGIGCSIPDQFEIEAGERERIVVDYQRTVIDSLGDWGSYIEGIHRSVWDDFCHYVTTLMFVSVGRRVLWQIRWFDIAIESTTARSIIRPSDTPVRLCVFVPDGNCGRMNVVTGAPAALKWERPHALMRNVAEKVFSCKGHIEDAG